MKIKRTLGDFIAPGGYSLSNLLSGKNPFEIELSGDALLAAYKEVLA